MATILVLSSKGGAEILKASIGVMMKISPEAQGYAGALYHDRHRQNLQKRDWGLVFLRAEAKRKPTNIIQDIVMYLAESHKQTLLARMESFVAAYRKEGLVIDAEDYNEILDYLRTMTTSGLNSYLHDMRIPEFKDPETNETYYFIPQHRMNHLDRVFDDVRIKLDIARQELILDAKQRPNLSSQIHITGNNYGQIQQHGQGNIQILNKDTNDETK
jgi:hypothetical protein